MITIIHGRLQVKSIVLDHLNCCLSNIFLTQWIEYYNLNTKVNDYHLAIKRCEVEIGNDCNDDDCIEEEINSETTTYALIKTAELLEYSLLMF